MDLYAACRRLTGGSCARGRRELALLCHARRTADGARYRRAARGADCRQGCQDGAAGCKKGTEQEGSGCPTRSDRAERRTPPAGDTGRIHRHQVCRRGSARAVEQDFQYRQPQRRAVRRVGARLLPRPELRAVHALVRPADGPPEPSLGLLWRHRPQGRRREGGRAGGRCGERRGAVDSRLVAL